MTVLRKISLTLLALLAVGLVGGWIFGRPWLEMGTGYVAKQVCSCVYVGERPFADCAADLRRYGPRIHVEPTEGLSGVMAEIYPLASATAYYFPGTGCTQE